MTCYALDNAAAHSEARFAALASAYDPPTRAALARTGIGAGWRCLDVGGGGGTIGAWLSDRVGPSGHVLVTDIAPQWMSSLHSRENVRLLRHDIVNDAGPDADFDLVHARLVLLHLPERQRVLPTLSRCLRPGGWLVVADFDCSWLPVLTAPTDAAAELFAAVHGAFVTLLEKAGADPEWGRKNYAALTAHGIEVIEATTFAEAWPGGSPGIDLHRANAEQLRDRLFATGVTGRQLTEFLALLRDPTFTVNSYPLITVLGRRSIPAESR